MQIANTLCWSWCDPSTFVGNWERKKAIFALFQFYRRDNPCLFTSKGFGSLFDFHKHGVSVVSDFLLKRTLSFFQSSLLWKIVFFSLNFAYNSFLFQWFSCLLTPTDAFYISLCNFFFFSICSIGLARATNGVTSAKSTYQTTLLALEIMSLVNVTRIMLLRSLLICEKRKLQKRRKKKKRNVPFCKLKQWVFEGHFEVINSLQQ